MSIVISRKCLCSSISKIAITKQTDTNNWKKMIENVILTKLVDLDFIAIVENIT